MRTIIERVLLPAILALAIMVGFFVPIKNLSAYTGVAYLIEEYQLDAWTTVCVYERLGKKYLLQISSLRWCPATIEVEV